MYKRVVLPLFSLLFLGTLLFAQGTPPTNISLPFFEDFAYAASIPNTRVWEKESEATVTHSRAVGSPTPGVVTFDAAQRSGLLHTQATPAPFAADELVSLPIEIPSGQDSLYLSFLFQPGGAADAPARGDSLLVDFYDPLAAKWFNVWGGIYLAQRGRVEQYFRNTPRWDKTKSEQHSSPQQHFFRAHIPLRESRFKKSGFRFRFRNLASIIRDNTAPGRTGNSSQWHVDMVYLNANRTYNDTLVPDVACTETLQTPFKEYSAVPYFAFNEYIAQRNTEEGDFLSFSYKNFGRTTANIRRSFTIEDLTKKVELKSYNIGNVNITPLKKDALRRTITYPWSSLGGSDVHVRVRAVLQTDKNVKNIPFRWNDTIRYEIHCTDEYAYDQGEVTSGYGIIGVGAERAAVAMRFRPITPTAIKAVRIWFNPIADQRSRKRFRLCFWKDEKGRPGKKVYEQIVTPPHEDSEVGKFYEIALTQAIKFEEAYFVGWEQIAADMLNIGYDAATPYSPPFFIRTSAQWVKSKQVGGALMLRLVCGGEGIDPESITGNCGVYIPESTLYPNPASDLFVLQTKEEVLTMTLYNAQGGIVRAQLRANEPIAINELPRGMYLLRIVYASGALDTKKLILY